MKTELEILATKILILGNDNYLNSSTKWKELVNEAKKVLKITPTEYPYIIHYCYGGSYKGESQYKELIFATSEEHAKYKYFTEQGNRYEIIYSITQVR